MAEYAVQFKNVSKVYRTYDRPSKRLLEMLYCGKRIYHHSVVALDDVSFTVERGTTFGIVGRNGSGKSTALQIMAGILEPSVGEIKVNGRTSALLELGSGFNLEFSGIDNVYLYAAILGLSNEEIETKIESILEFSEIGDFVYQPVKTYSSGMIVRLAFSVAISVDPDVLIVDEALSVGDALFQHKCMLRMREIIQNGTTVIFVSHDLAAVKSLCQRAVLLEKGKVVSYGTAEKVATDYHKRLFAVDSSLKDKDEFGDSAEVTHSDSSAYESAELTLRVPPQMPSPQQVVDFKIQADKNRFGTGEAEIVYIEIMDVRGQPVSLIEYGQRYSYRVHLQFREPVSSVIVGVILRSSKGVEIIDSNNYIERTEITKLKNNERLVVDFSFENTLCPDYYSVNAAVCHAKYVTAMRHYDWINNALVVQAVGPKDSAIHGVFYPTDVEIGLWRDDDLAKHASRKPNAQNEDELVCEMKSLCER